MIAANTVLHDRSSGASKLLALIVGLQPYACNNRSTTLVNTDFDSRRLGIRQRICYCWRSGYGHRHSGQSDNGLVHSTLPEKVHHQNRIDVTTLG